MAGSKSTRASIRAMEDVSRQILAAGSSAPVEEQIAPLGLLFDLTGEREVDRYDQWFAEGAESLRRESLAGARGTGTAVG